MNTNDLAPAVAVAPDGNVGVLWYRDLYDDSSGTSRDLYNVYFAVLDASGDLVYGPANVTNNTEWYEWDTHIGPRFDTPRIAATDDPDASEKP